MSRVVTLMVAFWVAPAVVFAISVDPGIIYNLPTGTTQLYNTVGIPFHVNTSLTLTALGAYDYEANGLTSGASIRVDVRNFTPGPVGGTIGSSVPGTSITLNSSSSPAYGSVWAYLSSPVTLGAGWYVLYATGFDQNDPVISGMGPSDTTLDTFGGAVSYGHGTPFSSGITIYWIYTETTGGASAWVGSNSAPIHTSGGTLGVPEPSTYAFMGTVGMALYFLRRRKAGLQRS